MPVLSSFISYTGYKPKRKTQTAAKVSSPFQPRSYNSTSSPHPYAPRVLDIHDERVPAPSPNVPAPNTYYSSTSTPRVQLDVDIKPEPLTDWFPEDFLKSDPFTLSLDGGTMEASGSGSGAYCSNGRGMASATRSNYNDHFPVQAVGEEDTNVEDDEDEEIESLSSAEGVLANLEALDASDFGNLTVPDEPDVQPSWRKPAPTPIKIPNAALHGPKVQLVRSTDPSRPTSQISSPESSAISGTTLARALLANTFVLSGESRTSRYRSGMSNLTRTDSATLPRSEFSLLHSPYWRDRSSTGDMIISPISAPPPPPVPINAELVYVPPQTTRSSLEPREKRRTSTSGSLQSERDSDSKPSPEQQGGEDAQASRRISRITEATSSPPSSPPLSTRGELRPSIDERPKSPARSVSVEEKKFSHHSLKDSDMISEGITSPALSEAPSSAKDIDGVLDYYSFADTPDPTIDRNFRPPFSPITEESSSQLSPPTPFRPGSRSSGVVPLPPGRFFLGQASPTVTNGGVRVDWTRRNSESRSSKRDSIPKLLLPIGERPTSTQISHPPTSYNQYLTTTANSSSTSGFSSHGLLPPPVSTIFNRQRSGSAPSPIKVVRDSYDLGAYNITVTPRISGSTESTPTTGDSDIARQTFPETPSAFSPGFSPNGMSSPGMPGDSSGEYMSMAVPQTPMSAFLPSGSMPSMAQQVLLTRAATSVRGARHSRQASMNRIRMANHQYVGPSSIVRVTPAAEDGVGASEDVATDVQASGPSEAYGDHDATPTVADVVVPYDTKVMAENEPQVGLTEDESTLEVTKSSEPHPFQPFTSMHRTVTAAFSGQHTETSTLSEPVAFRTESPSIRSFSSHDHGSGSSDESMAAYGGIASIHSHPSSVVNSRAPSRAGSSSGSHLGSSESPNLRAKTLSRIPPAPKKPPPPPPQDTRLASSTDIPSSTSNISIGSTGSPASTYRGDLIQGSPLRHPEPIQTPTPVITPVTSSSATTPSARRPVMISPPLPQTQLPPSQPSASSLYSLPYDGPSGSFGSPPPYYAVIKSDRAAAEAMTPSTSGSYDLNYKFGIPSSPHINGEFSGGSSDQLSQMGQGNLLMSSHRRHRARPPLPAGPRRPSQTPLATIAAMRERGGSISSVASNIPSGRRLYSNPLPSPRFQTPPVKWRGYTMDAAKWTFTSTQLQAIVSRAIRQSSEASSIRLLRLETLDNDIPEEVERLETQRTEVKAKYKSLSRRRANLLDSLGACVDGLDQDGPARAIRMVEDLKDISAALDRLAEELHSVDEQLAQVSQLIQGHSTSALAMALRKLNGSFLKQFAEAQTLRKQVESLETERDEAWKQAEDAANDYDDLRTGKMETPDVENRFSRVMAVRKSSVRAAKAGLHSAGYRASQRASVGSSSRGNPPSSARTTFYVDDIPPVPPMPRRRPVDIMTDLPLRNSVGVSTSGPTPTSETRAMVRAQEELYDMLGISVNDNRSRRSRSVIGLPSESEPFQQVGSPSYSHYDGPPNTGRRASLPGSAAPDAYNAFTADVSIILTSDRAGWI